MVNKMNYIVEILKQIVSRKRLIIRNKENKRQRVCYGFENDKYRESFIVVKFQPNSMMSQQLDPNRLSIIIKSDKRFDIK